MSFAASRFERGSSVWFHPRLLGLTLVSLSVLWAMAPSIQAAPSVRFASATDTGRVRPRPMKQVHGKRSGKARTRKGSPRPASGLFFLKPTNVVPNQQGKIVVFPFKNDDGNLVSTQVGQLLEARGLEVVSGVSPVDNADQYRDVATHLKLIAYVDGDVRGSDTKATAMLRVRSGFTGRHVLQTTFTESRANLPREISDKLWTKLGPVMARATVDATKPRKQSKTTLQINAGTPIEPTKSKAGDAND